MSVKIGVCADLHVDIMHDCEQRLTEFLDVCSKENVDFIIQLGDFCYPEIRDCICEAENRPINVDNGLKVKTYTDKDRIIDMFNNCGRPAYHVIGNHDCDMCSKEQILAYYNAGYGPYYSFDMGGFHFVVLDPNYMKLDGEYVSYDRGNYFDESYRLEKVLPYLPDKQLKWLEKELASTPYPSVLFSHQMLTEGNGGILNYMDFRAVIDNAPNKVVLCANGHLHVDTAERIGATWYLNINSMSNYWVGKRYMCNDRYSAETYEKYPNLKYVIPYEKSLFSIINLDEKGATIKGRKTTYVGDKPEDMGLDIETRHLSSAIEDRYLSFASDK